MSRIIFRCVLVLSLTLGSYLNTGLGMNMGIGAQDDHACCRDGDGSPDPQEPEKVLGCCVFAPGILGNAALLPIRPQGEQVWTAVVANSAPASQPETGETVLARAPPGASTHFRRPPSSRAPPFA
ncbi:MAG: hypothetical protein ABIJ96_12645 [Elusimicrobiota bacterium]